MLVRGPEIQLLTIRALENQNPARFGNTRECRRERHGLPTLVTFGSDWLVRWGRWISVHCVRAQKIAVERAHSVRVPHAD